jgi:hypothetical protein
VKKAKLAVALGQIRATFRRLPAADMRNATEVNQWVDACVDAAHGLHNTVYVTWLHHNEEAQGTNEPQNTQFVRQQTTYQQGPVQIASSHLGPTTSNKAQHGLSMDTSAQQGLTRGASAQPARRPDVPVQHGSGVIASIQHGHRPIS